MHPTLFISWNIIISFSIIFLQMAVAVLCRHLDIHLHWYNSALWLLDGCAFLIAGIYPLFQMRCEWFHLLSWHFLFSSVSATEHISIISVTCVYCYIKCFHHGYYLVLSSSPWYIFIFRFFLQNFSLYFSSSSHSWTSLFIAAILSLLCCSIVRHAGLCCVGTIVVCLAWMVERLSNTGGKQYGMLVFCNFRYCPWAWLCMLAWMFVKKGQVQLFCASLLHSILPHCHFPCLPSASSSSLPPCEAVVTSYFMCMKLPALILAGVFVCRPHLCLLLYPVISQCHYQCYSVKGLQAGDYYIFVTIPFSLCMPQIATVSLQFLLVCACH